MRTTCCDHIGCICVGFRSSPANSGVCVCGHSALHSPPILDACTFWDERDKSVCGAPRSAHDGPTAPHPFEQDAPTCQVRELKSKKSLSVELWQEANQREREQAGTAVYVLFVARDQGSLHGLQRHHGQAAFGNLTAIPPEKAHLFYTLGMKFRYAFLIDPTDEMVAGIKPWVTEQLTIARKI